MSLVPILALIAILFLGAFWILKKFIGLSIPPLWGALFIYAGAFIFTLIAYLIARPEFKFDMTFKKGIILALVAGILIAAFDVLNLTIFKKGGDVALFAPLLSGGAIIVASIAGALFLKESISLIHFLGILAIIGGIILLTR